MTEWDNDRQKRFWKACGCVQASGVLKRDFHYEFGAKVGDWRWPDGSQCNHGRLPDIHDLNALFKYAVPKLYMYELNNANEEHEVMACVLLTDADDDEFVCKRGKDVALTLAEAIEKVIVK